jgi:demethylmenaquinone methyltransferase/2-methoxy-6-polyprenyl-1,4-benzoquinol methylase
MKPIQEMKSYYSQRAKEYEKVYDRPERQEDLKNLGLKLQDSLYGHRVLEVACGTGYWTQVIANSAQFILASDQSLETLEIARTKDLPQNRVTFVQDDAYTLKQANGNFTAGFAGFWWSHIPKSKIREFLTVLHSKILPGSRVVFVDNEFKEGNSTPFSRTDVEGNTYQTRELSDGSSYEVIKNFPTAQDFNEALKGLAEDIVITRQNYFWILEYKTL